MDRKKRVLSSLVSLCLKETAADPANPGFTAEEVARQAGTTRSNASSELNGFVKDGLVVKFSGRPVRFVTREYWERKTTGTALPSTAPGLPRTSPVRTCTTHKSTTRTSTAIGIQRTDLNPFQSLVGWDLSLHQAVEQAKAALAYPPQGLHCLLTGPTGSGKTLFAQTMFKYAQALGRVPGQAGLVTFNCADYAHNPQLLMSHLFGYVKGAFTGAVQDKAGLVDQADAGILFLDEIHRLPAEGQEMLFYLMDTGQYRRLGEVGTTRICRTLVLGATTADPRSSLLLTFYRRFPLVIKIPALSERPLPERLSLVRKLLRDESRKIGRPLRIEAAAIRALLLYDCPGNAGQLFNDIRLTCARALLEAGKSGDREITITVGSLPPHIRQHDSEDTYLEELTGKIVDEQWCPTPEANRPADVQVPAVYEAVGLPTIGAAVSEPGERWPLVKKMMKEYYQRYLAESAQEKSGTRMRVSRLVGQDIMILAQEAAKVATGVLGDRIDNNTFLALALHLGACRQRLNEGLKIVNPYLTEIKREFPQEVQAAEKIVTLLEQRFQLQVPADEAGYLAMLFQASDHAENQAAGREVGIAVMAHGRTGSSMVEVANRLAGVSPALALDVMPGGSPDEWLGQGEQLLKQADRGWGVLLFVDMEPLGSWGEILARRTGLPLRIVDNVSTPLLIEALSHASRVSLDKLAARMERWRQKAEILPLENQGSKVIVLTCLTGHGTAQRIKAMLNEGLGERDKVNVISVDMHGQVTETGTRLHSLKIKGKPLVVIGSIDLNWPGVPFISLEEWFLGQGRQRLLNLLHLPAVDMDSGPSPQELEQLLGQYLRFLNPGQILKITQQIVRDIGKDLHITLKPHHVINLVVHLSCLVERLQVGEQSPSWPGQDEIRNRHPLAWTGVVHSLRLLEETFNLSVPESEIAFVVQFLLET